MGTTFDWQEITSEVGTVSVEITPGEYRGSLTRFLRSESASTITEHTDEKVSNSVENDSRVTAIENRYYWGWR